MPRVRRLSPWLLVLAASAGCVDSAMMHAAHEGDRAALSHTLVDANARGSLALSAAAHVAHAVVARELEVATPEDAVVRVKELRACVKEVDGLLASRMKKGDAAAGEAAFERAEAGELSDGAARDYAESTDDHFRAVAMWGMTRDRDHDARLHGIADGSTLVRRAALRAIVTREDPSEYPAVLEAARVDPDPLLRSTATRALARLPGAPADLANRLRDLWTAGDEGLREDIAAVFASRAVFPNGGREALTHLLAASGGNETVSVAGVILGANVDDAELRASATAQLATALNEGGHGARLHAIAVAPAFRKESPTLLDALRTALRSDDTDVQLAALARFATSRDAPASDHDAAITTLEGLAQPPAAGEPESPHAARARSLLADAGDLRVQAWLEADLHAKDRAAREAAAAALAALGRASRAAPLLADDDPSVRMRVACAILVADEDGRRPQLQR